MLWTAEQALSDLRDYATRPDNRLRLGFEGLDNEFRGVAPGELLMLISRSFVGKTGILCNVICNRLDTPQLLFSLEMPARLIYARLLAIHYDIPYRMIEDGLRDGHPQVMAAFETAPEAFENVAVVDSPGWTTEGIGLIAQEYFEAYGRPPRLISVDYLELLGGINRESPVTAVAVGASALKELAKKLDCAVICLHQVGRGQGGNGGKPLELMSAKYGGETESDYLLAAYRPSLDQDAPEPEREARQGEIVLQILKNRDGSGVQLDWHYEMDLQTIRMRQKEAYRDLEDGASTNPWGSTGPGESGENRFRTDSFAGFS